MTQNSPMEKYLENEQILKIEARRAALGPKRLEERRQEWTDLVRRTFDEQERESPPTSARAQKLAKRFAAFIEELIGNDMELGLRLMEMYSKEASMAMEAQMNPELVHYVSKMMYRFYSDRGTF